MGDRMKKRNVLLTLAGCAILLFAIVLSVRSGSVRLSYREFLMGLMGNKGYEKVSFLILNLRLPRTFASVLAGVGLSVSGLALQNITGNDLAGPNIIGVNAGAGFFVIAGMYFLPGKNELLPYLAFFGAFISTVLILIISGALHHGKSTIILSGIAVTALLNAGISLISRLDNDLISLYNDFSVGGLSGCDIHSLIVPMMMILISFLMILYFSKDIDVMMLGDGLSKSMGVNVRLVKWMVLLSASMAAGAVVSFAGLLGFVGLIVPHMARRLFSIRTKTALFSSVLLGAVVVCLADTIGRSAIRGTEIPVGIVMAFVGVPFFLYLIARRRAA